MQALRKDLENSTEEKMKQNNMQITAALKERDRLQAELAEAEQREVIYVSQIEDAQITLDQLQKELRKGSASEAAAAQLADTQIALKAVSEELQRKNEEFNAQEIEAQVKLRESQQECELVVEECERLKLQEAELKKQVGQLQNDLTSAKSQIDQLKLRGQQSSEEEENTKVQLSHTEEKVKILSERESQLENTLKEVETQLKNAQRETEEMKLFSGEQIEQMKEILEGRNHMETELMETIGTLNAEKMELEIKLRELEGQEVVKKEEQTQLMAARQTTLEERESELKVLQDKLNKAENDLAEAQTTTEYLEEELEKLKNNEEDFKVEEERLKAQLKRYKTESERLETELSTVNEELKQKSTKIDNLQAAEEGLLIELEALKKIESDQRNRLDILQISASSSSQDGPKKELEMLRRKDEEQSAEMDRMKVAEGEYKKLLGDAQSGLVRAADEITALKNKEEKLKAKLRQSEEEKRQLEEDRNLMEEELNRITSETSEELKDAIKKTEKELERAKENETFYRNKAEQAELALDEATQVKVQLENQQSATSNRCERCSLLEGRIAELEHTINITSESGIEDAGSSPDYFNEDPVYLKQENEKLKARLHSAQEKMLELRTCLVITGSQKVREECAVKHFSPVANLRRMNQPLIFDFNEESGLDSGELREIEKTLAGEVEKYREENFLLQARLDAKEGLLRDTVDKYRDQLRETSNLGKLVQELFRENGELVNRFGGKQKVKAEELTGSSQGGGASANRTDHSSPLQELYIELERKDTAS